MKRWVIVATVLGILLLATAAVFAGPTDVGGNIIAATSSGSRAFPGKGIPAFPGKGVPHGKPFVTFTTSSFLAPTDVGGN